MMNFLTASDIAASLFKERGENIIEKKEKVFQKS